MSVGDFNVSFATNDSIRLTIFHEQKFNLKIKNKQTELTTRYSEIMDDVLLFILLHIYLLVFFNYTFFQSSFSMFHRHPVMYIFFYCYMDKCHITTTWMYRNMDSNQKYDFMDILLF